MSAYSAAGTDARETANKYVRQRVLFTSVLFIVAVAQRFRSRGVRVGANTLCLGPARLHGAWRGITSADLTKRGDVNRSTGASLTQTSFPWQLLIERVIRGCPGCSECRFVTEATSSRRPESYLDD